ncbi:MAG: hypothetical protein IPQ11_16380 [Bacteroidetes bacterium]|nr:hypothetical protein [Bacteroidota bacterium]
MKFLVTNFPVIKQLNTFEFTTDIWIIKLDGDGSIVWEENSIGGDSDDYVLEIPLTADGGVLLGGFSFSSLSGDKTQNRMSEGPAPIFG